MRKNRFCTFTIIASLAMAALPASLAAAGTGTMSPASSASLPVQKNVTLTIHPEKAGSYDPAGASYTAYRVMSMTQTEGSWQWNIVNGFSYPGSGSFNADELGSYPAAKLQNLADQLALQVTDEMTDKLPEQALSDGACSWTTDKLGIYLVCETVTPAGNFPASPFLVALPYTDGENENSWNYSLTAAPKGSAVGVQKVIHDAKGSYINEAAYDGSKDTVALGDTVQYRISTKIPSYTAVYFGEGKNPVFRLTDTMAKGLSLTASSLNLSCDQTALVEDRDYTQSITAGEGGVTVITINLTDSYLRQESHQNKEIILAYSAVVNDSVSLADNGNDNEVKLNYSYDPMDPESTNEVTDDTTVYSFGIEVEKYDGDSENAQKARLEGAQFALYKETSPGCTAAQALSGEPYRDVAQTDEHGILDFKGIDAGTYYLKEVKAPDGYSLLTNPIKVEIIPASSTADSGAEVISSASYTAKVNGVEVSASGTEGTSRILNASNREETVIVSAANHHGFSLPITGGSGIAVILVISAAGLMTATVLYLRSDKRKRTSAGA